MKRKYILILALILAIILFGFGVLLGWSFEKFKSDVIYNEIRDNELDTDSYLTEQQFIDRFGGDKCTILGERVRDIQVTTRDLGYQVSAYGAADTFTENDFNYLKRKYFISEVRFLNLIQELNAECNQSYDTILFFYDIDDVNSEHQGGILDSFAIEELYNPIILSIDREYTSEPLVELLLIQFNVTEPAIVINGVTLPAVVEKEEIIDHLQINS